MPCEKWRAHGHVKYILPLRDDLEVFFSLSDDLEVFFMLVGDLGVFSPSRWRPGSGAAGRVHVKQHHCHRRGLGPSGPQVRPDVRQARLRALVRRWRYVASLSLATVFHNVSTLKWLEAATNSG